LHGGAFALIPSRKTIKKKDNMKSKYGLWLSVFALVTTFASCSKDPLDNMTEEESRIYITNNDPAAQFANYKTYSISDTVTVNNDGQVSKQSNTTDQAFISAVKNEMQARGFTLVNRNSKPDLGVNVNRIYNTSTGIIRYDDYYNNYYGSYWGYSGYGYYSPYSYATYSIREGALSIDMLDLKNAATTNRIGVVWNGLIRGSGIFNASTAPSQVKALFEQSPYLKTQ
jgi:hypothetical protein